MRNPFGNISAPQGGYIWDYARARERQRAQLRRVRRAPRRESPTGDVVAVESVPGLNGRGRAGLRRLRSRHHRQQARRHLAARVPPVRGERQPAAALDHPPAERSHERHQARRADAARDGRRQRPGARPPGRSDLAAACTGRTRRSSSSKTTRRAGPITWIRTGRSLLVASPFAKRGVVDHTFYTTSRRAADDRADPRPAADEPVRRGGDADVQRVRGHAEPRRRIARLTPRVPLDEKNLPIGVRRGDVARDGFLDEDRTPEVLLNEIIWRSVKGAHSPMPPPRRSVFVRPPSRNARRRR